MTATPDTLTKRPSRVVPVTILALLLVVLGGGALWLLGTYAATGNWPDQASAVIDRVSQTQLNDPGVIAIAAAVALCALIFLISAIVPGDNPNREIFDDEVPGQTAMSRKDVAQFVQARARRVDGAQSAAASLEKNILNVHVHTPVDNADAVRRRTDKAVATALEDLRPAFPVKPRVRVSRTD